MGYAVPTINLSAYAVGQQGQMPLAATMNKFSFSPANASLPMHLRVYNDSGSALQVWDDAGVVSDYIPAGAWPTYTIAQDTTVLNFKVIAALSATAPITLLMATLYGPGEEVPPTPQLGNSPIGGAVNTSSVQTLSQEGQPKVLLVIDIGDSVLAQLIKINNDGTATWNVDVAGVVHSIFNIASAANFLKIGEAGDVSEVLGKLTVDQLLTGLLGIAISGASSSLDGGLITTDNAGNMTAVSQILSAQPAINPTNAGTSINGNVAGKVVMNIPVWGVALKIIHVAFEGYSSTATAQFTFPGNITWGFFAVGNISTTTLGLTASGVSQSMSIVTGLPTGSAAGTSVGTSTIRGNSYGQDPGVAVNGLFIGTTSVTINTDFWMIGV